MTRAATEESEHAAPQAASPARERERLWSQADSPASATTAIFAPRSTCQAVPCPLRVAETFQMPVTTNSA